MVGFKIWSEPREDLTKTIHRIWFKLCPGSFNYCYPEKIMRFEFRPRSADILRDIMCRCIDCPYILVTLYLTFRRYLWMHARYNIGISNKSTMYFSFEIIIGIENVHLLFKRKRVKVLITERFASGHIIIDVILINF